MVLGRFASHEISINPTFPISLGDIRSLTDRVLSLRGDRPQNLDSFLTGQDLGLAKPYADRILRADPLLQKAMVAIRITEDPQAANAALALLNRGGIADGLKLVPRLSEKLVRVPPRLSLPDEPSRFLRAVACHFLPHDSRNFDFSIRYSPGIAGPSIVSGIYPDDIGMRLRTLNNENQHRDLPRGKKVFANTETTADLGLGWLPYPAGWSIMGGKKDMMWLFAHAPADIHVFDPGTILDVDSFVDAIQPFGGYRLFFMEDFAASISGSPDRCFRFERAAAERSGMPVTHDDQKAFATSTMVFFINTMRTFDTSIKEQKIIIQGAGAAGLAAAAFLEASGVDKRQIYLLDSKGLVYHGRKDLNPGLEKMKWARPGHEEMRDVFTGATFYIGASAANAFEPFLEYVPVMANKFGFDASANPTPEAEPAVIMKLARRYGKEAIVATGRTQDENVTNNGLIFPNLCAAVIATLASQLGIRVFLAMAKALADIMLANNGLARMRSTRVVMPTYYHPRVYPDATFAAAEEIVGAGVGTFPQVPAGRNARDDFKDFLERRAEEFVNPNKDRAQRDATGEPDLYLDAFDSVA